MSDPWTLEHAIEIVKIGAQRGGYRAIESGLWCGDNHGPADATFHDWGLCKAVEVILNHAVGDLPQVAVPPHEGNNRQALSKIKVKIPQGDFATRSDEWLEGFQAGTSATLDAVAEHSSEALDAGNATREGETPGLHSG